MAEQFANQSESRLDGPISAVDTSLDVMSASSFPAIPPFRIVIDNEIIRVEDVTGATFGDLVRGYEGTTATSHEDLSPVAHVLTAGVMADLIAEVEDFLLIDGSRAMTGGLVVDIPGTSAVNLQVNGGLLAGSTTDYGLYVSKTGSAIRGITRTISADLTMNNNNGSAGSAGTAIWANAIYSGSHTFSHIVGTQSYATATGTGVLDRLYGQVSKPDTNGLGTVNELYGQYIYAPSTAVGTGKAYGIFIEDYAGAAVGDRYAIYSGNGKVYLNGVVGIGLLNASYGQLQVSGVPDSTYGNVSVMDSTSMALGVGGVLALVGNYTGTTPVTFATIKGVKENATNANYQGDFVIATNLGSGAGLTDRVKVDSLGRMGIGTMSPLTDLEVRTGASGGGPATSGASGANTRLRVGAVDGNVLDFGTYAATPYGAWLQAHDRGDQSTNFPLFLQPNGGSIWTGTAARATNATTGFMGLPTCAGTPTGIPANIPSGQAPAIYDTTAHKIWVYDGAAWIATAALA